MLKSIAFNNKKTCPNLDSDPSRFTKVMTREKSTDLNYKFCQSIVFFSIFNCMNSFSEYRYSDPKSCWIGTRSDPDPQHCCTLHGCSINVHSKMVPFYCLYPRLPLSETVFRIRIYYADRDWGGGGCLWYWYFSSFFFHFFFSKPSGAVCIRIFPCGSGRPFLLRIWMKHWSESAFTTVWAFVKVWEWGGATARAEQHDRRAGARQQAHQGQ